MFPDLQERLRTCRNLPSLPSVALQVIELGQDPEASLKEVARVIGLDPALTSKILRIANSPLYAGRRKSENLLQALNLLGLNAALTLALSFSLVAAIPRRGQNGLDYARYWRRSLIAAVAARATAEQLGPAMREEAFLGGLLQDIGMVALQKTLPESYAPLLVAQHVHRQLEAVERHSLNTDHAEVGAWLLQLWRLPEPLSLAVAGSHEPDRANATAAERPLVECVALSGWIADTWLAEDRGEALRGAQERARARLRLDETQFMGILEAVGAELPHLAAVLELDLLPPERIESLLDIAKEILMVRNLQVLQEAYDAKQRADFLETRTRALEEQTRRDGLTGMFNRAYLDEFIAEEFQQAGEQQWPLSLAFLDVDHFKHINDTYGHQAGDEVLVALSRLLDTQIRRCDIAARYGGEEFVLVLPGVDAAPARSICERIVEQVAAQTHVISGAEPIAVTCSIGVATHNPETPFEGPEALLRAADRALYLAKQAGRNRVVVYGPP